MLIRRWFGIQNARLANDHFRELLTSSQFNRLKIQVSHGLSSSGRVRLSLH